MISLLGRVNNLANDSSVGHSDNQSVFWGGVLVLVLDDELLSLLVVSLA
jgi:hypothetical protein